LRAALDRRLRRARLYGQAARVILPRGRGAGLRRLGRLDERPIFVVGSPRSGTTFLARSLGSVPGLIDLGELAPLKAALPELAALSEEKAAARLRRIMALARRAGLVGSLRAVEQTPEGAFLLPAIRRACPQAGVVHVVRDGRDVVASLNQTGWLRAATTMHDDVGSRFGAAPRFWVEPAHTGEFASASDARRAAWAWRRYVSAVHEDPGARIEVRYERMVTAPAEVAKRLAAFLDLPAAPLARAMERARAGSVGRYARDLGYL
jgi:hypothetical protein